MVDKFSGSSIGRIYSNIAGLLVSVVYFFVLTFVDFGRSVDIYLLSMVAVVIYGLFYRHAHTFFNYYLWGGIFYIMMGMLVYEYREVYYFNFQGDYILPYRLLSALLFCGSVFGFFQRENFNSFGEHSLDINKNWLLFFLILGSLSAAVLFRQGIPALASDVNFQRALAVESNKGMFWLFYMGLQPILILGLIRFFSGDLNLREKLIYVLLIGFVTMVLSLYGGRYFVFMPVIVFLIYMLRLEKFTLAKGAMILFGLLFAAVSVSYSRFLGSGTEENLLFVAVRNDLFPEMRTLIQIDYLMGSYIFDYMYYLSPFVSFMPSFFYDLIGVDKSDLLLAIGKYLNSFDPEGEDVGYRVSFLGETYLAFGLPGIFVSSAVVLILSNILSGYIRKNLLVNTFVVLHGFLLIPYGITLVRSSLSSVPLIVFIFLVVGYGLFSKKNSSKLPSRL